MGSEGPKLHKVPQLLNGQASMETHICLAPKLVIVFTASDETRSERTELRLKARHLTGPRKWGFDHLQEKTELLTSLLDGEGQDCGT